MEEEYWKECNKIQIKNSEDHEECDNNAFLRIVLRKIAEIFVKNWKRKKKHKKFFFNIIWNM